MSENIERTCLCGNKEFVPSQAMRFTPATLSPSLREEGYYPPVVEPYECTNCALIILLKISDAGQYEWAKEKKHD